MTTYQNTATFLPRTRPVAARASAATSRSAVRTEHARPSAPRLIAFVLAFALEMVLLVAAFDLTLGILADIPVASPALRPAPGLDL